MSKIYGGIAEYDCIGESNTRPYIIWKALLQRCFDSNYKEKHPQYKDVTIAKEWLLFSNFKSWYISQYDYENREIDKDLIVFGNKHYSKELCILIPREINNFLRTSKGSRGKYPLGVSLDGTRFKASIRIKAKLYTLGRFNNPEDAHIAWQKAKIKQLREYSEQYLLEPTLLYQYILNVANRIESDLQAGRITD